MTIRSIHPFPARMAPELALNSLRSLPPNSLVLDPMTGSGTVLRQAVELGHRAIGFDLDPLAVLMSRVWTSPVQDDVIESELELMLELADGFDLRSDRPTWQRDEETQSFLAYWFAPAQRRDLTRLALALDQRNAARLGASRRAAVNVLRLALSRIIITKEQCASLARDTSHSRPHRVSQTSEYDVRAGYLRSVSQLRKRLAASPVLRAAHVGHGDARELALPDGSIDAALTSPPYLNAIDYMRGHRLALVWLGHSLADLREIRSDSVGAERGMDGIERPPSLSDVVSVMIREDVVSSRTDRMVHRYADDLLHATRQIARVLRPGGLATYVVGNSCLKGTFIDNAAGVVEAARLAGMQLVENRERPLPAMSRYLPITANGTLAKRMRTEAVLTFRRG